MEINQYAAQALGYASCQNCSVLRLGSGGLTELVSALQERSKLSINIDALQVEVDLAESDYSRQGLIDQLEFAKRARARVLVKLVARCRADSHSQDCPSGGAIDVMVEPIGIEFSHDGYVFSGLTACPEDLSRPHSHTIYSVTASWWGTPIGLAASSASCQRTKT